MTKSSLLTGSILSTLLFSVPASGQEIERDCGIIGPGEFCVETAAEDEEQSSGPIVLTLQAAQDGEVQNDEYFAYQAIANGSYSNLDQQITAAEEFQALAQAEVDEAADNLAAAVEAYEAALADIDEDEQALLDAVLLAQSELDAAQAVLDQAADDLAAQQAIYDAALLASQEVSDAFNDAVQARIAAEEALDADPTNVELAQALIDAQAAEDEAAAAIAPALALLDSEEAALAASLAVEAEAAGAVATATATLASAQTDAETVSPTTAEIQALFNGVTLAEEQLLEPTAQLAVRSNTVSALERASEVLTGAADNENEAIKAAADAYLGVREDTYAEVEVVAALVDHESRISANAEGLVEEAALRIAGDAATLVSANAYTDQEVAAEAALRIAGDAATLVSANAYTDQEVAAEAALRIAGDNALGGRIDAEASARIAADNALGGRIDAEVSARIAADDLLRDQIASSTATAIALGGNTILPDTNFTLSGNVGFYEGAQAIALNAAAKVSPNTYVTGAFGGGLNKDGKLGGRIGVVFGF